MHCHSYVTAHDAACQHRDSQEGSGAANNDHWACCGALRCAVALPWAAVHQFLSIRGSSDVLGSPRSSSETLGVPRKSLEFLGIPWSSSECMFV
eukprot:6964055-Lingulodinium_polyedra.AAC.1